LRTRLHQALAFIAVSTASATASSPALSADLPPAPLPLAYQQAPLPPQNVFEGWYLGGTIGGATVNYDLAPASGSVDTNGVLGGVLPIARFDAEAAIIIELATLKAAAPKLHPLHR
jgi:outer membrane immunogenic protein